MKFLRKIFENSALKPPPLPEDSDAKSSLPDILPIRVTVGPSPWAWRDRSYVTEGNNYSFRELGEGENLSGVIAALDEQGQIVLLLDFQIYARFLDDGRVLMWWEEGNKDQPEIAFASFAFSTLKAIKDPTSAARRMREEKAKTVGLEGIEIHRFECFLGAGSHPIDVPKDWSDFEETLVLADYAPGGNGFDVMHRALFVFDWIGSKLTILPQDWFNNGKYDFGYQWVARIARTKSGGLIGEGIRLGIFELDDSGREVKRWLRENPFHMI